MKRWLTYFLKWIVLVVIGLPFFLVWGGGTLLLALPIRAVEWATGVQDGIGQFMLSVVYSAVRFPRAPWRDKTDA